MELMTARQSWSDDRLDDLNRKVDDLNRRVDDGFKELRGEMYAGFAQLRAEMHAGDAQLRVEMKVGFDRVDARVDALNRTIIQVGGGLIGTMIVASAGLIATQL